MKGLSKKSKKTVLDKGVCKYPEKGGLSFDQ